MPDASERSASLRTQLSELNIRGRHFTTQTWQIPFAYLGIAGVSLAGVIQKDPDPEVLFWAFLWAGLGGVLVLAHFVLVQHIAIRRTINKIRKVEDLLSLPPATENRWYEEVPLVSLLLTASIFCFGAACQNYEPGTGSNQVIHSTLITQIVTAITALGAVAAAAGAWWAAWHSKKATQGNLFSGLVSEYASKEMGDAMRELNDWWGQDKELSYADRLKRATKWAGEVHDRKQSDALVVNGNRRRVAHYFHKLNNLRKEGFLDPRLLRRIVDRELTEFLLLVLKPLEEAHGERITPDRPVKATTFEYLADYYGIDRSDPKFY